MPRRKQDKPQHLEEEDNNTMDQLAAHRPVSMEHKQEGLLLDGLINSDSKLPESMLDRGMSNGIADAALSGTKDDGENRQQVYGEDVEEESEPAIIGSEEWLNVKETLASLQQQMQILRLQHFKFMQLFSSQNHNSSAQTSALCESDSVPTTADGNQDKVVSSPPCPELTPEGCNIKTEVELGTEDGDEKFSDVVDEDIEPSEQSPSTVNNVWPENDDQGEPVSFDCTHCSAVLPSPELLKIHMFSHERREAAAALERARRSDQLTDQDQFPSASSTIQSSSSFPSLPPSYQSIINDLSNDSLEDYMEIQKPENTHLEHLVKNMDGTVTDPNQCLICKRILSCKSALMMHYRTHTGERPFKCKLCSRAFTTKGNLKTHMGVHRAKPPLRLLHNCTICNKQFTNALVLNQHMKMHSEEAARKRSFDVQGSVISEECKRQRLSLHSDSSFKEETPIDGLYNLVDLSKKPPSVADFHHLSAMGGGPTPGFPFEFNTIPTIHDQFRYAEAFARQWEQFNQYPMFNPLPPVKPPMFSTPIGLHASAGLGAPFTGTSCTSGTTTTTTKTSYPSSTKLEESVPLFQQEKPKLNDIESDEKSSVTSQNERTNLDSNRQSASSPKSDRSWDSNDTSSNSIGMKLDPPPGTNCDLCLKTFACRSALEIHYRSHTKHRPFKCDLCDKSFTTRGNMKQHILTHKTDDIQWNSGERVICMQAPSPPNSDIAPLSAEDVKKTGGRHQCSVCLKHFSSASAVQIHFRTHTGDRPFKCSVCGKAFTTKGNLKVHMGTHMWNGSTPFLNSKQPPNNSSEANGESHEDEITPVTSPNRANLMAHNNINNNNMSWNPFNPNPLMKASLFSNPAAALMANYSSLFLPPGILPPASEEPSRPWIWPTACHICNKECHTSAALEAHLKSHFVNENGSSKPVAAS